MHFFRNFDWLPCKQRFLSCMVLLFTKSFKWLVCHVVGLFMLHEKQRDRQAMQEWHWPLLTGYWLVWVPLSHPSLLMHSFRVPFPTLPSILSLYVAKSHLPGEAKHETLGSLSDAFEQHTSTGCGPFSPLMCLDASEFVLLSVFTLTYRDNLPQNLFKIMAQEGKKSTSGWCALIKNITA